MVVLWPSGELDALPACLSSKHAFSLLRIPRGWARWGRWTSVARLRSPPAVERTTGLHRVAVSGKSLELAGQLCAVCVHASPRTG
jgi:hypothetical protein